MNIIPQSIKDILLLEPKVYDDERGFFLETQRSSIHEKNGIPSLIQHNQSRSKMGVLRGLHYQSNKPQGKLVRCSYGKIFDVAVDIRKDSSHFGEWVGAILDDQMHKQLWIPEGFAHGFLVISEIADVCYSCSNYYSPESEIGIAWDDSDIAIKWPNLPEGYLPIISSKDSNNLKLKDHKEESLPSLTSLST